MARPLGSPKFGGRKKGTPNKRTQDLFERIMNSGKDPVTTLKELQEHTDPYLRLAAAKELLAYAFSKKKALEISGPDGAPIGASEQQAKLFTEWLGQAKAERK